MLVYPWNQVVHYQVNNGALSFFIRIQICAVQFPPVWPRHVCVPARGTAPSLSLAIARQQVVEGGSSDFNFWTPIIIVIEEK